MLFKMLVSKQNYDRSLRQRCVYSCAVMAVGLLGVACYFLLVPGSGLSAHAQGFYLGAATGLTAGGLVLLLRTARLVGDPEAKRRARIEETDERRQYITNRAAQFAGLFTFFVAAGAIFVVLPLSFHAYLALTCVLAVYCLGFVAARLWLSRRV